ncbi:Hypothetical protein CINCED_3A021245 [Cinara cedri]|uniref:Uncharacterized protein n=1 Tax=Cinara cedri TaxID=506608 RepID=A0A5E4M5Z0_9HEMI|nr:Hypothetical protein CINCED_3A021245 [Cinara cedri]
MASFPQGSDLSPDLFKMFTDDIPDAVVATDAELKYLGITLDKIDMEFPFEGKNKISEWPTASFSSNS